MLHFSNKVIFTNVVFIKKSEVKFVVAVVDIDCTHLVVPFGVFATVFVDSRLPIELEGVWVERGDADVGVHAAEFAFGVEEVLTAEDVDSQFAKK